MVDRLCTTRREDHSLSSSTLLIHTYYIDDISQSSAVILYPLTLQTKHINQSQLTNLTSLIHPPQSLAHSLTHSSTLKHRFHSTHTYIQTKPNQTIRGGKKYKEKMCTAVTLFELCSRCGVEISNRFIWPRWCQYRGTTTCQGVTSRATRTGTHPDLCGWCRWLHSVGYRRRLVGDSFLQMVSTDRYSAWPGRDGGQGQGQGQHQSQSQGRRRDRRRG